MRVRALLALTAFAGTLGLGATASADPYYGYGQNLGAPNQALNDPNCRLQRQNRAMIGGAVGAALGAVLGNNVAARNAQSEGSILGGVLGAGAGALVGRNSAPCNRAYGGTTAYGYGDQGYRQPPPPPAYPPQPYYGDRQGDYPLAGGPDDRGYDRGYDRSYADRGDCRWGTIESQDRWGRPVSERVYMCRAANGTWRVQR